VLCVDLLSAGERNAQFSLPPEGLQRKNGCDCSESQQQRETIFDAPVNYSPWSAYLLLMMSRAAAGEGGALGADS